MKNRYRLIQRGSRGGAFYCVDSETRRRSSLGTADRDAAEQIVLAKNQALRQPSLNLQIAKAYLAGSDSGVATRTWQEALNMLLETKQGATLVRWRWAARETALDSLRGRVIAETRAEHLLAVLKRGTVSTNVHLRKLHNFCLEMGWLPWPVLPKRQWPPVRYQEKRAITAGEHARIVAREPNRELRLFYELLWHLGGSQSDVASLRADDVCRPQRLIGYHRRKTGSVARLHYGPQVEAILNRLPSHGMLFPRLAVMHERHRAKEFKRRCTGLGITGISLHSYRYAWAERAKAAGYPERFAQEALGHNSKAVHRAYARHAEVLLPSLEEFEARPKVVAFPYPSTTTAPAAADSTQPAGPSSRRARPSIAAPDSGS